MTPKALAAEYLERTEAWSWNADGGPSLHGRCWNVANDAPQLHFIHGTGFCGGVYWPFLRLLREHSNALLHDVQGHGGSEAGHHYLGPRRTARRALACMHSLSADADTPCIGMGHSFGGYITLLMACAQPERFERLILLDPILLPRVMLWFSLIWNRINPLVKRAARRRAHWDSLDAARKYLRERGIFRNLSAEVLECYVQHCLRIDDAGQAQLCCPPWLEAALFAHPPLNTWSAIRHLQVPTLILYGKDSYPFMRPAMQQAARMNPRITLQPMQGGHFFMLENPEDSAQAVRTELDASPT